MTSAAEPDQRQSTTRGERVDRYQEIAQILWDERLYQLILAALILGTAMLLSRSDTISNELLIVFDVVALAAIVTVTWLLISAFRRSRGKRR